MRVAPSVTDPVVLLDDSPDPSADDIRSALEKVLASDVFRQSHRLQEFLRFIVDQTLRDPGQPLKEYIIGVEVFGRKETFDSRLDPIVRVEAGRLRKKLTSYYDTAGQADAVRIDLPKRTYSPVFVAAHAAQPDPRKLFRPSPQWWALAAAALLALAAAVFVSQRGNNTGGSSNAALENPVSPSVAGGLPDTLNPGAIAVLPFNDLSPGRDQEYFCEGLTDELINALGRVGGLQVVPRTSSFRFKGESPDLYEISRQLGARIVLEGSVRKAGDRLRVAVQAIDISAGYNFWSETYDKSVTDVFAIQSDIAGAVVDALTERLDRPLRAPGPQHQTESVDAFNLYLLGRYHWNKRTEHSLIKAIGYFEDALAKDPRYALAYSGIADSYALLVNYGELPPREAMPKAKAAALKALEIDETLAEAHTSMAYVLTYYEWNWPEAERHFQRALELNPNYSDAQQWFSSYLGLVGREQESALHFERARRIDPLSVMLNWRIASQLVGESRFAESLQQCQKTLDLDPSFPHTYRLMGLIFERQGQYDKAIEVLEKGRELAGGKPQYTALIARNHALADRHDVARELLAGLLQLAEERYVFAVDIASVYASLGEHDLALRWLEQAYQERSPWLPSAITSRYFHPLRATTGFNDLYAKLNLPPL